MNTFHVEKGIPVPEIKGNAARYPFQTMEPGDSFFIPVREGETLARVRSRAYSASRTYGIRHKKSFLVRTMGNGVRVWRKE